MDLKSQKQLAAKVLNCGVSRIWIDSRQNETVAEAITLADIRNLVKKGVIKKIAVKGVSRTRARKTAEQKKKGRQKGQGTRKGKKTARAPEKRRWISRIRAQRLMLRELKSQGTLDTRTYRALYLKAKAGFFRSRAHIKDYLVREGIVESEKNVQTKKTA